LLSKTPKINNNNFESEEDDSDCIIIENNDIKIDWDSDKEHIIKIFSPFRNLMNKKKNLIYS
jgi:hypothetical protein